MSICDDAPQQVLMYQAFTICPFHMLVSEASAGQFAALHMLCRAHLGDCYSSLILRRKMTSGTLRAAHPISIFNA